MADKQTVPHLDIGPGYPEALRDLVKRMTSQDIGLRPSAAEARDLLATVELDPPREATEDAPTEEADRTPSAPAAPPPPAPPAAAAPEPTEESPTPIDPAPSPDLDPAPPIGDDVDWPPRRRVPPILLFVIAGLVVLFVCGGVVSAGLVVALGFL
jgi:hypothetical protein